MSPLRSCLPAAVDFAEMSRTADAAVRWVWEGYLAFGSITLLTSRWKSGKTTLLSVLLARLHQGGTLAGSAVTAAPVVVVSEEAPALWVARGAKMNFGPRAKWICQPFLRQPDRTEWADLVARLGALSADQPTLIAIDPLATILPGSDENNASTILNALAPLRQLTGRG